MSCFINNTSENGVNQFAPFSIIAKPVGSTCNLRCKYCYYIDKASELGYYGKTIMTLETLENYIKKYILSHPEGHRVEILCNGGCQKDRFVPSVSDKNQSIICVKGANIFLNIQLRLCSS